jgi:hypothetical protein
MSKAVSPAPLGDSPVPDSDQDRRLPALPPELPREYGGRPGPEPTRYGDWEKNGRCIDF